MADSLFPAPQTAWFVCGAYVMAQEEHGNRPLLPQLHSDQTGNILQLGLMLGIYEYGMRELGSW